MNKWDDAKVSLLLVPCVAFGALTDDLVQIGLQVFGVLLVFGPLLFGKDGLGHREVEGASDAVGALIVDLGWKSSDGFFHVYVLVQAIVTVESCKRRIEDE